jgi:hypothetical protein
VLALWQSLSSDGCLHNHAFDAGSDASDCLRPLGGVVLETLDTSNPLLFERKELDAAKVWISTGTGITTRTARAGKGECV